ncbi:MAG: DUF2569 family protein, partial [Methylococcales bacterium]
SEQAIQYNENLVGGSMKNEAAAFVPAVADATVDSETVDQSETEWIDSTPASSSETVESSYKGVGGWLLFLCLSLTIFNPLGALLKFFSTIQEISKYGSTMPNLSGMVVIDGILSAVLMIFSVNAGLALWRVQPEAVQLAKRFLLVVLAYQAVAVVLVFMMVPTTVSSNRLADAIVPEIARALFYFTVWYSYLSVSKRVRATYTS